MYNYPKALDLNQSVDAAAGDDAPPSIHPPRGSSSHQAAHLIHLLGCVLLHPPLLLLLLLVLCQSTIFKFDVTGNKSKKIKLYKTQKMCLTEIILISLRTAH